jgi:tetratricopeptide (TPR) repeat protein
LDLNTLAAAYAEAGQFNEAVRDQSKALEDPEIRETVVNEFRQRLELYKQKKPYREAQCKVSETIPRDLSNAKVLYSRGMDWLEKEEYEKATKDFDEAIRLLDEVIRLDPSNAQAYLQRGQASREKNGGTDDFDKAIQLYDRAIRVDPNNAIGYLHRGQSWLGKEWFDSSEEIEQAIKDFDAAIELEDYRRDHTEADLRADLERLAQAYFHRAKAEDIPSRCNDKAIKYYDEAIRLDPQNALYYYSRGTAWLRAKGYDKAIRDFDEAIRLDSNNVLFFNRRGIVWYFKRGFKNAIQDFDEAIRLDPHNRYAYRRRSFIWLGKRDFEKAIKNCDEAILLRPNDAFFYYQRGEAWLGKEDFDKAIEDYDEAIRLSPKGYAGFAFAGRGTAWSRKKHYDKSIKDFDEAIRLGSSFFDGFSLSCFYAPNSWSYEPAFMWVRDCPEYLNAWKDFHEAIWLDPRSKFAHGKLAWLLATCPEKQYREGKRAIQLATAVCQATDWKSGWELNVLAAASAEAGQFDEAVRYQTKALEDPVYRGSAGNEFRQRLDLYKQKKPYRQSP